MQGIYIHIPFCRKVCYYCDFHFTVSLKQKDTAFQAILKEIDLRKDYLQDKHIETIYFGGGTPSVLDHQEAGAIIDKINQHFTVSSNAEITFETNPDDLSPDYLSNLQKLGINRLSIGIQSFHDDDLLWMNRRHNGKEAENVVKLAQDIGFTNINVDLIYGLPALTPGKWQYNIDKFFELKVPHLSAYHLSIEPQTVFGHYKRKGKLIEIEEEQSVQHYRMLTNAMKDHGYEHYEISNFCMPGQYSQHNTNYWKYGKYLGIGPAAHSYDGENRQWNNKLVGYLKAMDEGLPFYEVEELSAPERYNDFLLTGLRTAWGISFSEVEKRLGTDYLSYLLKSLNPYKGTSYIKEEGDTLKLTEEGMFVSDSIISELFYV